jgi:hypothetical protein
MTFISGKPDFPTVEEIFGTPEEIIQWARSFPELPLESLWARCLRCWSVQSVGRYRYVNERVELPDGSSTTAEDWSWNAAKAAYGRGWRLKVHCGECELITDHIAVKR